VAATSGTPEPDKPYTFRAHTPLIIERKGIRIAFLGYNEFFPRSFEADFDKPGIAWSEDKQVQLDIPTARNRYHADLVIPVIHWGWEKNYFLSWYLPQLPKNDYAEKIFLCNSTICVHSVSFL
jgi:poly-gamma-glutamate capsule biosynthesis protein CapA/YwtB (metallophosphatase superfamily)